MEVRKTYTRNRSEAVLRINLAQRALDEARARAEVDGASDLCAALDLALSSTETARSIATFEDEAP